jgi:hypothetical protein
MTTKDYDNNMAVVKDSEMGAMQNHEIWRADILAKYGSYSGERKTTRWLLQ